MATNRQADMTAYTYIHRGTHRATVRTLSTRTVVIDIEAPNAEAARAMVIRFGRAIMEGAIAHPLEA